MPQSGYRCSKTTFYSSGQVDLRLIIASIIFLGETSISNEKRILPNFGCTESNKSQIIAFGAGNNSIALVSKVDVEHEQIEAKFGKINDLMTNKIKHLLILTSHGCVLVYDTSLGCQLLRTHVLDSHPIPVKFLYENSR